MIPASAAGFPLSRCVNDTCGCHIGYVNLPHLGMDGVCGEGILERIPVEPPA